jgi:hypothetical protein
VTLAYTVGAEQVYVNGVLQVRTSDYTATNGTSVVLTSAALVNDVVAVIAYGTFLVADTYTEAEANALFIPDTLLDAKADLITATAADTPARLGVGANGTVLTADSAETTGLKWVAPAGSALTLIATGTAAGTATSLAIDNCFTSTYRNYRIIINMRAASAGNFTFKFRASGSDTSTGYCQAGYLIDSDFSTLYAHIVDNGTAAQFRDVSTTDSYYVLEIGNPQIANRTSYFMTATEPSGTNAKMSASTLSGIQSSTTQFDGINVINDTGNLTGTVRVYGYANS